ncbi:MAG: Ig-like domain-containing protein [Calditrichia bacterium]
MNRKLNLLKILIFALSPLLFFYCAHKVAPGGGPPDKTPPQVVRSFPTPDSVGISHLDFIEIEFSENIRKTSLLNNYWIIPELPQPLEVKWKGGRKVRFYLKDSLNANHTYLFTLGTAITDIRNNRMPDPFQLAFATGATLDSGVISGKIYADRFQADVFVYAYALQKEASPDSLLLKKAKYYTQIDRESNFRFSRLPMGTFRVIGLLDEDFNGIYDISSDEVGLPPHDVKLDSLHPIYENLNFYLIREDTSAPRIQKVDTISARHLSVEFDEPIKWNKDIEVLLRDSVNQQVFRPVVVSRNRQMPEFLELYFQEPPTGKDVRLEILSLEDEKGNQADHIFYLTYPSRPDTLSPRLVSFYPRSGESAVPYQSMVYCELNQPVDTFSFIRSFALLDEQNHPVKGQFDFSDRLRPALIPDSLLKDNTTYTIQIHMDSLRDYSGRAFRDSVMQSSFTTLDSRDLGEIAGMVTADDSTWTQAIVEAISVRNQSIYRVVSPMRQRYILPFLPEGPYILRAIADRNGNGKWDHGSTRPWEFAEPFQVRPDTISVRKRWTKEDINFQFKSQ